MIYIASFILFIICACCIQYMCDIHAISVKQYKFALSLVALMIFAPIGAFRDVTVGTDTVSYVNIFETISQLSWHELPSSIFLQSCPTYSYYCKFISMFSKSGMCLIMCNFMIFLAGVAYFIYIESKNVFMSWVYFIVFHYYYFAMNAARQSLAMMLCLYVFYFYKNKKYYLSLFFFILAITTHVTAAIIIPFIFCLNINMRRRSSLAAVVICCVLFYVLSSHLAIVSLLLPHYSGYVTSSGGIHYDSVESGQRLFFAVFLLVLFVFIYIIKLQSKYPLNKMAFNNLTCFYFIVLFFMFAGEGNVLFARLQTYYLYFLIIYIPYFCENYLNKTDRIFIYFSTTVVMLFPWYIKLQGYLPYLLFKG